MARALLLVTGDGAEADELAQEAFARTFERWDRVGSMDSPAGYVYRIALNLNRRRLRRLAMQRRLRAGPKPSPDPAEEVETRTEVLWALASLPLPQLEALVLVGWLGYGAEEAGKALGISATSVRGRIHRARATLRERFGDIDE